MRLVLRMAAALVIGLGVIVAATAELSAQQLQGAPGAAGTLEFPNSRVLPIPTPPFAGAIQPNFDRQHAGLAPDHRAARRRAECAADLDRRRRIRLELGVRWRRPHADAR